MRGSEEEFPTSTIEDLRLSQQEMAEANNEKLVLRTFFCHTTAAFATISHEKTKLRYDYSDYLIDPNKHRFRKVVRILALVLTFIKKASGNVTKVRKNKVFTHTGPNDIPDLLKSVSDKYLVTSNVGVSSLITCKSGMVVEVED